MYISRVSVYISLLLVSIYSTSVHISVHICIVLLYKYVYIHTQSAVFQTLS